MSWASFSEMKNTECSESPDELFAIYVFMRVKLSSFSSNYRAFASKSASRILICSTRRLTSVSFASTSSLLSRYSCHLAKTFSLDARSSCSCLLTSASRSSRLSICCSELLSRGGAGLAVLATPPAPLLAATVATRGYSDVSNIIIGYCCYCY